MNLNLECLPYPYAAFEVSVSSSIESINSGDMAIVNIEKQFAKNDELVLIEIDKVKEVSRVERIGHGPMKLFPHSFVNNDGLDDVIIGVVVSIEKKHS